MKRTLAVGLGALCLTWVAPGAAQPVADHLKCYKVKDPQAKAAYTATLDGLTPEAGCRISVPAKVLCTEAVKSGVTPTPPGGGPSGTPAGQFLCYKIKCPKTTLPTVAGVDQFGARTVTVSKATLLCAPFATTTTSTTTSSTTTTAPTCANGGIACGSPCGGACGGTCLGTEAGSSCTLEHCGSTSPVCAVPANGFVCTADTGCPSADACTAIIGHCGDGSFNGCGVICPE